MSKYNGSLNEFEHLFSNSINYLVSFIWHKVLKLCKLFPISKYKTTKLLSFFLFNIGFYKTSDVKKVFHILQE